MPLGLLEKVMYEGEKGSYKKAAAHFIATHEKMVDYWVTGKK